MKLSANTFVYEVGQVPIDKALESLKGLGFQYIDLAAYQSADPTLMTQDKRRELVKRFKGEGFTSSQLLLVHTQDIASSDEKKREKALDYMKKTTEFQLELGGKQVLVCWGCGVTESTIPHEQSWIYSVETIGEYASWCAGDGVLVGLEMDPHVYFVVNSMERMAKILEDINQPNVYPNVDIGHMCITRESPVTLSKFRGRILHVHLSETDTFEHTNSILGTGSADIFAYLKMVEALEADKTCREKNEILTAGIEMGEPGGEVDDPDRWMKESLAYLDRAVPGLEL